MKIMSPDHPKWEGFLSRLEGPEGCNFRTESPHDKTTWNCNGKIERPFAVKILSSYKDIDIPKTLKYFDSKGGYCDCEILFNIGEK